MFYVYNFDVSFSISGRYSKFIALRHPENQIENPQRRALKFSDETADQTTMSPKPENKGELGSRRNSLDSLISAKLGLFDRMFAGEAELEVGFADEIKTNNAQSGQLCDIHQVSQNTINSQINQVSSDLSNPVKSQGSKRALKKQVSTRPPSPRKTASSSLKKQQKSIIKKR